MSYKYQVNLADEIGNANGVEHEFQNPVSAGDSVYVSKDSTGLTNGSIIKVEQVIHFSDRSIIQIKSWD
jgi:hypothetical protein